MAEKVKLTDRKLQALAKRPAPAGQTYDVWDTDRPGLGVRVSETGRRTFVLAARFGGAKHPTRRALGEYGALSLDQAREKARDWLDLVRKGIDPRDQEERQRLAEQRRRENSFAAVAEEFIRLALIGPKPEKPLLRSGPEVAADIRRELIPRWGRRPVTEITPHDVVALVDDIMKRDAPYMARNLFATVRRFFNWAISRNVYGLDRSPCDRMKPKDLVGERVLRSRILDDAEIRALWSVTEELDYPYGPLFRLLVVTGQRKSEVAEARWSEFDVDKKLWTIPAARMKAAASHVVPLSAEALAILKSLPRFKKGDHIFSTTFGENPVNGFSKAKARLDKAMAKELGAAPPDWVIHDIRRTMRTGLSALPVPDLVRELVIAHAKPGLHKVYDQYAYLEEKRHALDLWAARLRSMVEPAPANVVDLMVRKG